MPWNRGALEDFPLVQDRSNYATTPAILIYISITRRTQFDPQLPRPSVLLFSNIRAAVPSWLAVGFSLTDYLFQAVFLAQFQITLPSSPCLFEDTLFYQFIWRFLRFCRGLVGKMHTKTVPLFKELMPYAGQIDEENRWIKMAELLPWYEFWPSILIALQLTPSSASLFFVENGRPLRFLQKNSCVSRPYIQFWAFRPAKRNRIGQP